MDFPGVWSVNPTAALMYLSPYAQKHSSCCVIRKGILLLLLLYQNEPKIPTKQETIFV